MTRIAHIFRPDETGSLCWSRKFGRVPRRETVSVDDTSQLCEECLRRAQERLCRSARRRSSLIRAGF